MISDLYTECRTMQKVRNILLRKLIFNDKFVCFDGHSNEYEDAIQDVVVLSDRTEFLPLIEIRIKECQGNTLFSRSYCYTV